MDSSQSYLRAVERVYRLSASQTPVFAALYGFKGCSKVKVGSESPASSPPGCVVVDLRSGYLRTDNGGDIGVSFCHVIWVVFT